MKRYILVTAAFFIVGCATQRKPTDAMLKEDSPIQAKFDQGVRALDNEQYQTAAEIFDGILLQKPGTDMDLVAMFNSGIAYEGLADCKKASERYRQVVRSSAKKFKRLEGEALFRLSMAYECMGQDAKSITALIDARNRGKELAPETLNAEIPARLAAAYSRLGNRQKALEYFNIASQGLKNMVNQGTGRVQADVIAKTLFLMGKLSPTQRRAESDPTTYLQSISMQQPYLLQAIELHKDPWSRKAETDLKLAYENIWMFKFGEKEKDQETQFYTRALQTINELKNLRLPKPDIGVDSVFAMVDVTERKVRTELSKVSESTKLTTEAQKRESLKQNGRLVDPKPIEQKKKATIKR